MASRAFKSLAEQTRLRKLVDQGAFPRADFEQMLDKSRGLKLPERLTPESGKMKAKKLSGRTNHY